MWLVVFLFALPLHTRSDMTDNTLMSVFHGCTWLVKSDFCCYSCSSSTASWWVLIFFQHTYFHSFTNTPHWSVNEHIFFFNGKIRSLSAATPSDSKSYAWTSAHLCSAVMFVTVSICKLQYILLAGPWLWWLELQHWELSWQLSQYVFFHSQQLMYDYNQSSR